MRLNGGWNQCLVAVAPTGIHARGGVELDFRAHERRLHPQVIQHAVQPRDASQVRAVGGWQRGADGRAAKIVGQMSEGHAACSGGRRPVRRHRGGGIRAVGGGRIRVQARDWLGGLNCAGRAKRDGHGGAEYRRVEQLRRAAPGDHQQFQRADIGPVVPGQPGERRRRRAAVERRSEVTVGRAAASSRCGGCRR